MVYGRRQLPKIAIRVNLANCKLIGGDLDNFALARVRAVDIANLQINR